MKRLQHCLCDIPAKDKESNHEETLDKEKFVRICNWSVNLRVSQYYENQEKNRDSLRLKNA